MKRYNYSLTSKKHRSRGQAAGRRRTEAVYVGWALTQRIKPIILQFIGYILLIFQYARFRCHSREGGKLFLIKHSAIFRMDSRLRGNDSITSILKYLGYILLIPIYAYADTAEDPCSGPNSLANIVNRPSNIDSTCVVPLKKLLLESGYQYQELINSDGLQQNAPSLVMSLGLPNKNELLLLVPNYIHQSSTPTSGFTATTLGAKHQFFVNEKWMIAGEGFVNLKDGSVAFGNAGLGASWNGIVTYTINDAFSVSGMLGGSTQTESTGSGGQRYASINPDIELSYSFTDRLSFFVETYGQSQTGPGQGWGVNADMGVIYLVKPTMTIDLEVAQRLTGELGGFERYVGAGMSMLWG